MQAARYLRDPLYRNSLFLMANTAVTAGLGFIFWMVVARFYTEAEVGLGSALISAMSLLALVSRLGLDATLIRFLTKSERPAAMINSCFTLCGIAALIAAVVYLVGLDEWSPALYFIRRNSVFAAAFVFFAVFWTLSWLMDVVFIARRRADFVLWKNTLFSVLKVPLPVLLVLYFHTFGIVASWGLAIGFALAVSFVLFMPRAQPGFKPLPKISLDTLKRLKGYSAGSYLASLAGAAPALILPIMIVNLLGPEQNAYFYVAWMIASLLFTIPTAVSQSLFAEGSHSEGDLARHVRRSYRFVFLLLIPALVVLLVLGQWLLLLFGASYSANALMLLRLLALSGIFVGINSVYYSTLRVERRIPELVTLSGFVALSVLITSYLTTPHTGIIGIGYAWIGAQAAVTVYTVARLRPYYSRRRARPPSV